ncbi:phospholipase A2 [Larimichthys crocea]|uniref:phospholipase A2 n=1 Tax=Larimichthys crocea TaxID=215358 RepID=UPI00054B83FA|nr:phospholipase A2, minor isoenzyme-like [Larimichthys crocea]
MKLTAPLLLLLAAHAVSGTLLPRALWQFGTMIQCAQPGVNPFLYNNYGCWCGFGGKGTPLDDLDRCCEVHDRCYRASRLAPGCTAVADLPYVLVYDFSCSNEQVTCSASNNKCQAAVCECDRVAAHCFAQHEYNPEHKNLDPKEHCVN